MRLAYFIYGFFGALVGGVALLALSSPEPNVPTTDTDMADVPTFEEFMATVEAESSVLPFLPSPTPDPRYRGCDREAEAFDAALINKYDDTPYLGVSRADVVEEYFNALYALGRCLGAPS